MYHKGDLYTHTRYVRTSDNHVNLLFLNESWVRSLVVKMIGSPIFILPNTFQASLNSGLDDFFPGLFSLKAEPSKVALNEG